MRQLVWMANGREESEWWRTSHLEAFVGNLLRFSQSAPVWQPKDINPFYRNDRPLEKKSMRDRMGEFFAAHPEIPVQKMRMLPDGTWAEVKDGEEIQH